MTPQIIWPPHLSRDLMWGIRAWNVKGHVTPPRLKELLTHTLTLRANIYACSYKINAKFSNDVIMKVCVPSHFTNLLSYLHCVTFIKRYKDLVIIPSKKINTLTEDSKIPFNSWFFFWNLMLGYLFPPPPLFTSHWYMTTRTGCSGGYTMGEQGASKK